MNSKHKTKLGKDKKSFYFMKWATKTFLSPLYFFYIITGCVVIAHGLSHAIGITDISEMDIDSNINNTDDYSIEKRDVIIEQVGCIEGSEIPENCIFSKTFKQNYEAESLYAVVSVANLSNETIHVWCDELLSHTHSCLGLCNFIMINKSETVLFFFKLVEDSVYLNVRDSKNDDFIHYIQLEQDRPIFKWNNTEVPSTQNANLEVVLAQGLSEQAQDVIDLQLAIEIKGELPVKLLPDEPAHESSFYAVKLVIPHRKEEYILHFSSRYLYRTNEQDSFLLLPGERIISDVSPVLKMESLNHQNIFIVVLSEELRNLFLQAIWSDNFFSAPFKIE